MPSTFSTTVRQHPELGTEVWAGRWVAPSADRHTHAGLQLLRTTAGAADLVVGRRSLPLRPDTLVVIPAGVVHAIRPARGSDWSFETAYVAVDAAADLLGSPAGLTGDAPVRTTTAPAALAAWDHWHQTATGSVPGGRRDALRAVLHHVIATPARAEPQLTDDDRLRTVRDVLDRQFADNRPVAEVAGRVGLSPEHLSRLFTRWLGVPPHAYRVQRRVQEALRLLGHGEPPATVAVACGFADQPHLTRHFRRVVGITPGRYAAAVKNGQDPVAGAG